MSNAALPPYPSCLEDFLSTENFARTDAAVIEIFTMMFGLEIQPVEAALPDPGPPRPNEKTAVVGFSGAMRGSCQIRVIDDGAQSIASAMLGGVPVDSGDDSIGDALGELCNMLAGSWKNGVPGLGSDCTLSPPTVISGHDYKVHMARPSVVLSRTYQFENFNLYLKLCREESAQAEPAA
jgi:chemotaxis protein CheX